MDASKPITPSQLKDAEVVNQYTGEKWVYSDIVKDHFFHPRNLQLEDPAEDSFDAMGMVGSPACLLPSTRVHTNPHVQTIDSISVRAKVLDHTGNFSNVDRVYKVAYPSAKLVTLKNQLGTITATPDHLVYGISLRRYASYFMHTADKKKMPASWFHAGDLKKGDVVAYPVLKKTKKKGWIEIPCDRKKSDFKSIALPKRIAVTPDLLEFFGYFVAEGHTKKSETGFTFALHEQAYVDRVCEIAKKVFGLVASYRKRPKNNRIDVSIYNVHLAQYLREQFGDSAAHKHIPDFILFLSIKLQSSFLKGVWRGDGHFSMNRTWPRAGYATTSSVLLDQMKLLLLRQGIVPSIYREGAKVVNGVSHQAAFRFHVGDSASLEKLAAILEIPFQKNPRISHKQEYWFDKNYLHLPIRAVRKFEYPGGRLYNFEVAKTHTYTTDAFLVHNCGDVMTIWVTMDQTDDRVKDMKWKTFGCGSAIAATSMFSVMVTEDGGMKVTDALKIRPQDIMLRLGGLPNRKIHCSVLADKAFRKAVNEYFRKTAQHERIVVEGARVVDKRLNVTDKDIEEAVLEGATTLEEVQKKLKVGVGDPEAIPAIEELIRFYKEKYYGGS